jgi:hypothetical protein
MTFVGVDQNHQVVSEPCIFDVGVLAVAGDFPALVPASCPPH